jgi:hypothetical protein
MRLVAEEGDEVTVALTKDDLRTLYFALLYHVPAVPGPRASNRRTIVDIRDDLGRVFDEVSR